MSRVKSAGFVPAVGAIASIVAVVIAVFSPPAFAQLAVSSSGSPTYSHAISAPPGVAGMSPNLGIVYSGGGLNGPVGLGWGLQGISSITRCSATIATDGRKSGVAYTAVDKLCLDGQRMIALSGAGGSSVASSSAVVGIGTDDAKGIASDTFREYRTEKDTYSRIRAYGYANGDATGASGPAYFKVWTKSGQVYEYGDSPSKDANTKALITPVGKTVAMVWAVSRIADTLGNAIDFKYSLSSPAWGSGPTAGSPTIGREWNLAEVQYAGNKIIFSYDERTVDRSEAYHQTNKSLSTQLLKSITSYVNSSNTSSLGKDAAAVAFKTTWLTYDNGPVTKRARLKSIQECAGDADKTRCLPAAVFSYASGGDERYQAAANFNLSANDLLSKDGKYGVLLGDFTGVGRTGFIRWSDVPAENQLWVSDGNGHFTQVPIGIGAGQFNITDQNLFKSDGCYASAIADFDGDGLPDILRYSNRWAFPKKDCSTEGRTYGASMLYLNKGNGSFVAKTYSGPALSRLYTSQFDRSEGVTLHGETFYLLDVDGDGKTDLVTSVFDKSASRSTASGSTHVYRGAGDGGFLELPSNVASAYTFAMPMAGTGVGMQSKIADLDGDGLADLVGVAGGWFRSRGDGNFDFSSGSTECSSPIDFNGDQRADCLVIGSDGATASNALLASTGTAMPTTTANFNLTASGMELGTAGVGIVVADVNLDGRQDIIRWKDDPANNTVYLSNGDGTFSASTSFNFTQTPLKKSDGSVDSLIGDFTGKGEVEILRLSAPVGGAASNNQLYVKQDSTPPDQLIGVATGAGGAASTLSYVSMGNAATELGARYTSDRGTANAASGSRVDLTFPSPVVATITTTDGVGGTLKTEYAYAGLKADIQGRGILGFRQVSAQHNAPDGSNQTVVTQYLQEHPYIGVASRTETYAAALNATSASNLLSRTINIYCDQTSTSGSDASATETSPCTTTAKIQRPYLKQTVETGVDLAGYALPQVKTVNTFNGSGDPTQIVVATSGNVAGLSSGNDQSVIKTTTNTYLADDTSDDKWVLGRLSKSTVQSTVPNNLSRIATGAGSAPSASATGGDPPKTIISPAALMGILQYLLAD